MTAQKTDQELWEWIEQNIDMKEIMENHMINTLGFHYALMTHITDWLRINQHAIDEILETAKAAYRMIRDSKDKIQTNGWNGGW